MCSNLNKLPIELQWNKIHSKLIELVLFKQMPTLKELQFSNHKELPKDKMFNLQVYNWPEEILKEKKLLEEILISICLELQAKTKSQLMLIKLMGQEEL